jgi:hypothetical protein
LHGHYNAKLPRKNTFLTSLYRIIQASTGKIHRIDEEAKHNAERQNYLSAERVLHEGDGQIENECRFFQSSLPNYCECNEKDLPNVLCKMCFTCSHLTFLDASQSAINLRPLKYKASTDKLEIRFVEIQENIERPVINNELKKKYRICETIRRDTKSKRKSDIMNFVSEQYTDSKSFIGGYPTNTIEIISIEKVRDKFWHYSTKNNRL